MNIYLIKVTLKGNSTYTNYHVLSLSSSYVPSQGDVAVFIGVGSAPGSQYVNALRWYRHIASYTNDERLA